MKKPILLFLALLFPACVFVFLKFFGKNEFSVPPLYSETYPGAMEECGMTVTLPYHIPENLKASFFTEQDSLVLIHFGELQTDSKKQLERVSNEFEKGVKLQAIHTSDSTLNMKKCVFFLEHQYDLVLLDRAGLIRGQYISNDREEMDRLLTELAILLKKY
ncbi:MAG TPA: hypothetical protein VE467_14575 [Chryseolinea sp.]|jgi:hypothetical protein|nr:hypothetical protein [Chryseolinea sp.]